MGQLEEICDEIIKTFVKPLVTFKTGNKDHILFMLDDSILVCSKLKGDLVNCE